MVCEPDLDSRLAYPRPRLWGSKTKTPRFKTKTKTKTQQFQDQDQDQDFDVQDQDRDSRLTRAILEVHDWDGLW